MMIQWKQKLSIFLLLLNVYSCQMKKNVYELKKQMLYIWIVIIENIQYATISLFIHPTYSHIWFN